MELNAQGIDHSLKGRVPKATQSSWEDLFHDGFSDRIRFLYNPHISLKIKSCRVLQSGGLHPQIAMVSN